MSTPAIAVVTGAGRGLGHATARALAERGYRVVVAARNIEGAQPVVDEITQSGGFALPLALDVADPAAITAARDALIANVAVEWPDARIEVLVNNAGIGLFAPLDGTTAEEFDRTFAVNVRGPLLLIQALVPHMPPGARIVNLSSSLSRHVSAATSVYAASKAAIEALSRSLASELGPRGIRINTIAPGPTATDFNGGAMRDNAEMRHGLGQQTALGRVGEPDEIAHAVAAFVSSDLRWVTGERLEVSGGVLL
jgi:NAD(P)-dependent dehydrogenase (short-subunit alcohol dehydrogenase family)